jgi:hypothetical protein
VPDSLGLESVRSATLVTDDNSPETRMDDFTMGLENQKLALKRVTQGCRVV